MHGNSRYEDTPGNGSVYVLTPWSSLVELQTIPHGHYYPANSESNVWVPKKMVKQIYIKKSLVHAVCAIPDFFQIIKEFE